MDDNQLDGCDDPATNTPDDAITALVLFGIDFLHPDLVAERRHELVDCDGG